MQNLGHTFGTGSTPSYNPTTQVTPDTDGIPEYLLQAEANISKNLDAFLEDIRSPFGEDTTLFLRQDLGLSMEEVEIVTKLGIQSLKDFVAICQSKPEYVVGIADASILTNGSVVKVIAVAYALG